MGDGQGLSESRENDGDLDQIRGCGECIYENRFTMNRLRRTDPCPCGSTKQAYKCCMRSSYQLIKSPSSITPKGAMTNISNDKCLLSLSNNCSHDISREHFISKSVLQIYSSNGVTVNTNGISWTDPNVFTPVSMNSLTVKSLCVRHNNCLSSLDTSAASFVKAMKEIDDGFNSQSFSFKHLLLSGEDFEKWAIKTIIGLHESGNIRLNGIPSKLPQLDLIKSVLSGFSQLPEGLGIYFMPLNVPVGKVIYHSSSIDFIPATVVETGDLHSATILINGIPFRLALTPIKDRIAFGIYHPRYINFKSLTTSAQALIELCWMDHSNSSVILTRSGSYDGPSPYWPNYPNKPK